jgi:hypothetical protein
MFRAKPQVSFEIYHDGNFEDDVEVIKPFAHSSVAIVRVGQIDHSLLLSFGSLSRAEEFFSTCLKKIHTVRHPENGSEPSSTSLAGKTDG